MSLVGIKGWGEIVALRTSACADRTSYAAKMRPKLGESPRQGRGHRSSNHSRTATANPPAGTRSPRSHFASVLGVDPKVPSGILVRLAANKLVDLELVCQRPGVQNRQVAQEQSDG